MIRVLRFVDLGRKWGASCVQYYEWPIVDRDSRRKSQNPNSSLQIKGSLTRDFRLQVFFMNQCPPDPQVFHWSAGYQKPAKLGKYSIGAFLNFFENLRRYSRLNGYNNLYFPGVVDSVQKKTKKPKIYRRCRWHRREIYQQCQRHRQLESPANISLPIPKNEK
jgi:hypothetical protein